MGISFTAWAFTIGISVPVLVFSLFVERKVLYFYGFISLWPFFSRILRKVSRAGVEESWGSLLCLLPEFSLQIWQIKAQISALLSTIGWILCRTDYPFIPFKDEATLISPHCWNVNSIALQVWPWKPESTLFTLARNLVISYFNQTLGDLPRFHKYPKINIAG